MRSRQPLLRILETARRSVLTVAVWALAPTAAVLQFPAATAQPLEVNASLGAGYDSNPGQRRESAGLAFARYSLDGNKRFALSDGDAILGLNAWYRNLEGTQDSHRLAVQGIWTRVLGDGSGALTVGGTAAANRDPWVPDENRDEVIVEIQYGIALSARDMLGISGEAGRLHYLERPERCAGRRDSDSGGEAGRNGEANSAEAETSRDDWQAGLALDLTHYWSPDLSTMLSVAAIRHESPRPVESYGRHAVSLLARLDRLLGWSLELGFGWSDTGYDRAPARQDREDIHWTTGLAARRTWGKSELSCEIRWLERDSTLPTRSYRQQVTQCGLSWSF